MHKDPETLTPLHDLSVGQLKGQGGRRARLSVNISTWRQKLLPRGDMTSCRKMPSNQQGRRRLETLPAGPSSKLRCTPTKLEQASNRSLLYKRRTVEPSIQDTRMSTGHTLLLMPSAQSDHCDLSMCAISDHFH